MLNKKRKLTLEMIRKLSRELNISTKVLEAQDILIYGTTTGGEFIDEEIVDGSIAVLLMDIDPVRFYIEF